MAGVICPLGIVSLLIETDITREIGCRYIKTYQLAQPNHIRIDNFLPLEVRVDLAQLPEADANFNYVWERLKNSYSLEYLLFKAKSLLQALNARSFILFRRVVDHLHRIVRPVNIPLKISL